MRKAKWLAGLAVAVSVVALLAMPGTVRAGTHDEEALKALEAGKLTVVKAVEAAESFSKGKAVAARVKVENTGGEVLVHCVVADKCMVVPVEIKTGKATKMSEATAQEEKEDHVGKARDIVKTLDENKLTLPKAILAAEEHVSGKALSVTSKLDGGKLEVVVHCHASGKFLAVTVDGKTGKVIKTDEAKKAGEKKPEEKKPSEKKPEPSPPGEKKPSKP